MRVEVAQRRNVGLDLLRLLAVLLVLGRHQPNFGAAEPNSPLLAVWHRGGWMGVDLFFVLSGFLVSGLLFGEHRRRQTIDIRRFLVRRWLRTLPPFWLLIGATVAYRLAYGGEVGRGHVLAELAFIQNYREFAPGLWNHTWSLAVEEHFYLLLPFVIWMSLRRRALPRASSTFEWIVPAAALTCMFCLFARVTQTIVFVPTDRLYNVLATHLRIDSLAIGVAMAQQAHFHPERFNHFFQQHKRTLGLVGSALILPAFLVELDQSDFLVTFGLTLVSLGCACFVGAVVTHDFAEARLTRCATALGATSYSIYLWHEPTLHWGLRPVTQAPEWFQLAVYLVGSLAFGYVAARLVELPTLRVRDRLFPSRVGET